MSRVERYKNRDKRGRSFSKGRENRSESAAAEPQGEPLPSRRAKHPSNKQQMANLFYNMLIVLFIILVIGLLLYGQNQME